MAALAHQPSLLDALEPAPAPASAPAGRLLLRVAAPPAEPAPAVKAERRTFQDVVVAAWEGLASAHSAECLVCGGDVRPRYGAGPKPVAGTCRDCGTEIT
jgi:hypothetical protein